MNFIKTNFELKRLKNANFELNSLNKVHTLNFKYFKKFTFEIKKLKNSNFGNLKNSNF